MDFYVTDINDVPRIERDQKKWAQFMERNQRVALSKLGDGRVVVSTVFLGLNHRFGPGRPLLWETMVFGGPLDGEQYRYESRLDAMKGHVEMTDRARKAVVKTREIDLS